MRRERVIPPSSRRRRAGQALAEFALVAPIFFLLLFAIVEGGRFMFYYEVLNNATREGARYAIVHGANTISDCTGPPGPTALGPCDPTGAGVIERVRSAAFGVPGSSISVVPTWSPDNGRGSTVSVAATYTYTSLVPLVPLPAITVEAESRLVINN